MEQGIEFIMNNGKVDSYDPINIERDFIEYGEYYILNIVYTYKLKISEVKSYRIYDLCEKCGREVYKDDLCDRCYEELQEEKKAIQDTEDSLQNFR